LLWVVGWIDPEPRRIASFEKKRKGRRNKDKSVSCKRCDNAEVVMVGSSGSGGGGGGGGPGWVSDVIISDLYK
jgi:hypothetical protein